MADIEALAASCNLIRSLWAQCNRPDKRGPASSSGPKQDVSNYVHHKLLLTGDRLEDEELCVTHERYIADSDTPRCTTYLSGYQMTCASGK